MLTIIKARVAEALSAPTRHRQERRVVEGDVNDGTETATMLGGSCREERCAHQRAQGSALLAPGALLKIH